MMEVLSVFAKHMKLASIHQLCNRCYRNLNKDGILRRALQTSMVGRQICSSNEGLNHQGISALNGSKMSGRSLVLVKGRDASDLLQGLMTNDIEQLDKEGGQEVIYSMFLNKQGRVLYDVLCYQWSRDESDEIPSFLLECDSAISQELQKHLKLYRIRKKVDITSLDSEYQVWSVFSPGTTPSPGSQSGQSHLFTDPRVKGLGQRVIISRDDQVPDVEEVSENHYRTHRYQWGVAEGVDELPPGECLPLESNLAYMNGVSFTKGCYLGQELTARTHHTGVIRKRIMPIQFTGNAIPTIPAGTSIKTSEGKNVGKLRCHLQQNGLALLRTALIGNKLQISTEDKGEAELEAKRPSWWPEDINK
ncbi:putative transferase CAF17, mitochondrial [Lytechinus pictus]|uniref:putative transferase CAF17, mitochondrial n=1 Tax=Lytechinus pictus TaxID=7653 RepID=UPI0030BA063A